MCIPVVEAAPSVPPPPSPPDDAGELYQWVALPTRAAAVQFYSQGEPIALIFPSLSLMTVKCCGDTLYSHNSNNTNNQRWQRQWRQQQKNDKKNTASTTAPSKGGNLGLLQQKNYGDVEGLAVLMPEKKGKGDFFW
jgi:hypothetical protein